MKVQPITINRHTVCVALTRPAMIVGVSLTYMGCVVMGVMSAFILFKSLWVLLWLIPLQFIGLSLCAIDYHIFDLMLGYCYLFNAANQQLWGCHSYEPY